MVDTGEGANNIFRQVYRIQITDMHHQVHGYFVLIVIGNLGNQVLTKPLVVSALQNLVKNAQEVKKFYYKVRSDMISLFSFLYGFGSCSRKSCIISLMYGIILIFTSPLMV